jgi:hypothetical protein
MVAQQVQMKDPNNYIDPETFNGFRFVKQREVGKEVISESRFSQPDWHYAIWGSKKQGWYIRLHGVQSVYR